MRLVLSPAQQLRNRAVSGNYARIIGILLFIAFRYDWTYAAGAVIAVFHDVLITLAFFSVFQWEVNLTVMAALLTLVGFSVNDSIVIFDRIRENLTFNRTKSLYVQSPTNQSIKRCRGQLLRTDWFFFRFWHWFFSAEKFCGRFRLHFLSGFDYGNLFDHCDCQPDCDLVARKTRRGENVTCLNSTPKAKKSLLLRAVGTRRPVTRKRERQNGRTIISLRSIMV